MWLGAVAWAVYYRQNKRSINVVYERNFKIVQTQMHCVCKLWTYFLVGWQYLLAGRKRFFPPVDTSYERSFVVLTCKQKISLYTYEDTISLTTLQHMQTSAVRTSTCAKCTGIALQQKPVTSCGLLYSSGRKYLLLSYTGST